MADGTTDPGPLRYRVPEGQDPVAVVTALRQAGFQVAQDSSASYGGEVLVTGAGAAQREEVRRVIAQDAALNLEDDPTGSARVRFSDE